MSDPVMGVARRLGPENKQELLDEFFLYEYDGSWRIGKDFNKPDCWAFTNQTNLSKMLTATWFESGKTKNKREITVQISPSVHRDDFGKVIFLENCLITNFKFISLPIY